MSSLPASLAAFAREASALVFWVPALAVGVAAVACAYLGVNALYRSRLITDMPTSKLRSAAQGYVELEGRARAMPGEPVYAPLSGKPCVWYRYSVIYRDPRNDSNRSSKGWETLEEGVSEAIFHLEDGTGVCIVDPDGAEVTPSVSLSWCGYSPRPVYTPHRTGLWDRLSFFAHYRYVECRIHDQDPLYAIGQFTGTEGHEPFGINEAARDLLALWKRDPAGLLRRFDADGDGKIDMAEWEGARQAAEREVIATWRERQQGQEQNLLKKPPHDRPYILSTVAQDRLIAGYRRKAFLGTVVFFVLGLLLAWTIQQRFG